MRNRRARLIHFSHSTDVEHLKSKGSASVELGVGFKWEPAGRQVGVEAGAGARAKAVVEAGAEAGLEAEAKAGVKEAPVGFM